MKVFVTIANTEEDEFVGSVWECAVKFTVIVKKIKTLVKPLPNWKCSSQVQANKSVVEDMR